MRGPTIPELPPSARPREKLLRRGARTLSDTDLLAVILGGGSVRENGLQLAGRLIRRYGIGGLLLRSARQWMDETGIGPARACRLAAATELTRRQRAREDTDPPTLSTPAEAFALLRDLGRLRKEHLVGLYLDAQNRLVARETLSVGSLNTTRTHPREILEPALRHLAVGFILAHNHPSGALTPSRDDVAFTRSVASAAELMDFGFLDHLIVTARGHVSLRERGLMQTREREW
ncbi:MAG: DNA repair protein RadC [Acidobacteriota bacterium]